MSTPIIANTTPWSTEYCTTRLVVTGTAAGSATPWKVAAPRSAGVRSGRPWAAS